MSDRDPYAELSDLEIAQREAMVELEDGRVGPCVERMIRLQMKADALRYVYD